MHDGHRTSRGPYYERRSPSPIQDRMFTGRAARTPAASAPKPKLVQDVVTSQAKVPELQARKPTPTVQPVVPRASSSQVVVPHRQFMHEHGIEEAVPENYTLPPKTKHLKLKLPKAQTVLVSMAVLVFGMGLVVNLQTMLTNHTAKAQVAALASRSENGDASDDSGSVPSETKPAAGGGSTYRVAPNLPKYLKISKLSVNARIRPLGVTSSNQLKAPTNIYDTGWYDASAHPGDSGSLGAVLIDGHVHGPTLPGVFAGLKKLQVGDIIQIVRGDDKIFNYKVVASKNYNADTMDMGELMASIKPGKPGLNLITCGGPYDKKSGEYTQRTVVFAVQI